MLTNLTFDFMSNSGHSVKTDALPSVLNKFYYWFSSWFSKIFAPQVNSFYEANSLQKCALRVSRNTFPLQHEFKDVLLLEKHCSMTFPTQNFLYVSYSSETDYIVVHYVYYIWEKIIRLPDSKCLHFNLLLNYSLNLFFYGNSINSRWLQCGFNPSTSHNLIDLLIFRTCSNYLRLQVIREAYGSWNVLLWWYVVICIIVV